MKDDAIHLVAIMVMVMAAIISGIAISTGASVLAQPPDPTPAPIYEPEPTDTFSLGPCVSLFNGESGTIVGQYYALTEPAAHTGGYGFISTGTGYLIPRIKHNTVNLTLFDEVWMWMRATQKTCEVLINGRSYKGDTQVKKLTLTTEWQLVRLDIVKDLEAGNGTLAVLNEWILKPVVGADGILPQFCLDDMWAVKLMPPTDPVDPTPDPGTDPGNTGPDPADPPPVVYGDWMRQAIETAIVSRRVGDNGTEQFYTVPVTITFGEPVLVTTPAPEVTP